MFLQILCGIRADLGLRRKFLIRIRQNCNDPNGSRSEKRCKRKWDSGTIGTIGNKGSIAANGNLQEKGVRKRIVTELKFICYVERFISNVPSHLLFTFMIEQAD